MVQGGRSIDSEAELIYREFMDGSRVHKKRTPEKKPSNNTFTIRLEPDKYSDKTLEVTIDLDVPDKQGRFKGLTIDELEKIVL